MLSLPKSISLSCLSRYDGLDKDTFSSFMLPCIYNHSKKKKKSLVKRHGQPPAKHESCLLCAILFSSSSFVSAECKHSAGGQISSTTSRFGLTLRLIHAATCYCPISPPGFNCAFVNARFAAMLTALCMQSCCVFFFPSVFSFFAHCIRRPPRGRERGPLGEEPQAVKK